jgi:hypothetical protein
MISILTVFLTLARDTMVEVMVVPTLLPMMIGIPTLGIEKVLCKWQIKYYDSFVHCTIGEVDFGSSICYASIWTAKRILRSNYKRCFSLFLALPVRNRFLGFIYE